MNAEEWKAGRGRARVNGWFEVTLDWGGSEACMPPDEADEIAEALKAAAREARARSAESGPAR
ncbi:MULTISPECIES: hypothetical protein [Planomonospora]|uniref:hypothetical protein n=1 Tax=Planomonospora sp. ID82291 TaxID=2738136 RepID=UPI0018C4184D|nr:hypothetical protein [Planomonospora sp. ID82291]MBG0818923.1 hypothetical protein [Planomonospora sp. ID82291]